MTIYLSSVVTACSGIWTWVGESSKQFGVIFGAIGAACEILTYLHREKERSLKRRIRAEILRELEANRDAKSKINN